MANGIWVGVNGYARKVKGVWVGVNGTARKVSKMWVGVNDKARLCYTSEMPTSVTLRGADNDTIRYTYNGTTNTVNFGSGYTWKTITINMLDNSEYIQFTSTKTGYSTWATIQAEQSNEVYVRPLASYLWYGYTNGQLSTFIKGTGATSAYSIETTSEGYKKIKGYYGGGNVGMYAGISVATNTEGLALMYDIDFSVTNGTPELRLGNATNSSPNPCADWSGYAFTSDSNIYVMQNGGKAKSQLTLGNSNYVAAAIYDEGTTSILRDFSATIKAFAID